MTPEKRVHSSEAPESDLLDQTIPADPNDTEEEALGNQRVGSFLVEEADWIDQQTPAPVDDSEQERT